MRDPPRASGVYHRGIAARPRTPKPDVILIARDGDAYLRDRLSHALKPMQLGEVPDGTAAPTTRLYRGSRLGLVASRRAMVAAIAVQRVTRVPWVALVDAAERRSSWTRRLLRQAAAVVVQGGSVAAREQLHSGRVVALDDTARVRAVLADIALAEDARPPARTPLAPMAEAWTFLNDRATRLAIRLVPLTGKAPKPIHPKHLLDVPWHVWYVRELEESQQVLDVGCSNGAHSLVMAAHARYVVGVDVDAVELGRARANAAAAGVTNVDFVHGDVTDPATLDKLPSEGFDVVVAFDVLEHLAERDAFLHTTRRLLAPGGRLLLSVPNRNTPYKLWRRRLGAFAYTDADHKVEYTETSLRSELANADLAVRSLERGGYDTPFGGWTALVGAFSLSVYRRIAARRQRRALRHPEWATGFRVVVERAQVEPASEA